MSQRILTQYYDVKLDTRLSWGKGGVGGPGGGGGGGAQLVARRTVGF